MKTLTKYILHGLNNFRKEREAQTLGSSCQVTLSESQVRDLPNALSGTGLESQLALKTDFCLFPNTILSMRLALCVTCAESHRGLCLFELDLKCLFQCSAVAMPKCFTIFEQGALRFHFALGLTNDIGGPAEHVHSSQSHFKASSKCGKLCP